MSIFGKIKDAIFGHAAQAAPQSTAPATDPATISQPATSTATPVSGAGDATLASAGAKPAAVNASAFDVAPALDAAVKKSGQKLDWKHSIVDLMKALGMDASLQERKELATELGYTGDQGDSAKMNMWLHKALMKKLAENGGKVPPELLD